MREENLYEIAYRFLCDNLPDGMNEAKLEKYYHEDTRKWTDLKDVFIRFIISAQNYQRMPKVIKYNEREPEVRKILMDYDYLQVASMDEDELYRKFRKKFHITSKDSPRNSWHKWSCSIIDISRFVSGFKSADDFKGFINLFSYNTSTRMALPLLISTKIRGIGFALACDALKELGYSDYPKPDVHMIKICNKLGFCGEEPYEVFEALVRIAEKGGVTPYQVDKVLWLISSGNYYMDEIKGKPMRDDFIQYALEIG